MRAPRVRHREALSKRSGERIPVFPRVLQNNNFRPYLRGIWHPPDERFLSTIDGKDDGARTAVIAEFAKIYTLPCSEIQTAVGDGNRQRNAH